MKITTRPMNVFEQFLDEIDKAKAQNLRVDTVEMTKPEYDEFYQLAQHHLALQALHDLQNRREIFGIKITINNTHNFGLTLEGTPDKKKK